MATQRPTLVRTPRAVPEYRWEGEAADVLRGREGFTRVLGGPGTGKTSLLADVAARRILHGRDPERLLVLTASRHAADALRETITRLVTAGEEADGVPRTVREPLVRTVHSYAFGVLRAQANQAGMAPPRLLSGPEQDAVIRDLLAGDVEEGAGYWPEKLRPALRLPAFAEQLRDLLLRAAERGLGPDDLTALGRDQGREEWVAAGRFWQQYEQVTLLSDAGGSALAAPASPALDAAELVSAAVSALLSDAELLGGMRENVRYLLVDDAQHLDPLQWRLIGMLGDTAREFVLAGDPDQAVFSFRGADPRLLADADPGGERTVVLRGWHRMPAPVHEQVVRIAESLPGTGAHRPGAAGRQVSGQAGAGDEPRGAGERDGVVVRWFATPAAEASWIADQLRRAHLTDGTPWSEMAVLTRSVGRMLPALLRAFRSAGVPVVTPGRDAPLARHDAVRPLLTALRVVAEPAVIDNDVAEELLASPLGGADPLALRRLRRGLRRLETASGGERGSDELLVGALRSGDPLAALAESEAGALRRINAVLAAGSEALRGGGSVEWVLWRLWEASGLQQRWVAQAERSGTLGRQADNDLDAVVALFHAAGHYVDRLPHAGVTGFADYLLSQHIAGDSLAPTAERSEGVEVLTAHAAAGRQWQVVAVPGLQEGSWPDLRLRGSLLGVERMVDVLSGVDTDATSAVAPILAEERRLLYVAASRTRCKLVASAVSGEDEQPSRFLDLLAPAADAAVPAQPQGGQVARPLVLSRLVGDLRVAACDPDADPGRRRRAARQLARLAQAGVPGAHPDSWYGLAGVSTVEPLHPAGEVVTVSPSTVDVLVRCPLRWLVERHGGTDPAELPATAGIIVHGLAHAAAGGATEEELSAALDEAWARVDAGAPWFWRRERSRVAAMVDTFTAWLERSRDELTQDAVESDLTLELPDEEGTPKVRLRGRVDRLERDRDGRPVIVDIKSAKTPVSVADTQEHPQLASYQLAVSLSERAPAGGARLVYPAKPHTKTGATQRAQEPLDEDAIAYWLEVVRTAAVASVGPEYVARENPDCPRCPVRPCCPLQPEGRQVTV
ncbi:ATP-dependent DNA helicase [Haloechinothrix sp. LS1_15]|uniref:ATP-dependent helicase n=1 Tax=Haloechinothrix sp. LS1_15 TaxID=2652248 RepID=UPI002946711C|nr:ATP-dependent DNA helicase [Haloechinothrix sp. LS1_15]MDV6013845.1 ATP-dependent helicase [Haloechinothrix sp. LS1_15]